MLVSTITFFSFTSTKAQNSSAVDLLTEEDFKFMEEKGMKLSDFTDEHIKQTKQTPPEAHEQRIKTCMEMKDANFIDREIDCVSWMLTLEGNYKLIQWLLSSNQY